MSKKPLKSIISAAMSFGKTKPIFTDHPYFKSRAARSFGRPKSIPNIDRLKALIKNKES